MKIKFVWINDAAPIICRTYMPYLKGFSVQIYKLVIVVWLKEEQNDIS